MQPEAGDYGICSSVIGAQVDACSSSQLFIYSFVSTNFIKKVENFRVGPTQCSDVCPTRVCPKQIADN